MGNENEKFILFERSRPSSGVRNCYMQKSLQILWLCPVEQMFVLLPQLKHLNSYVNHGYFPSVLN